MINLGGGFPTNYISEVNPIQVYAEEITRYLSDDYHEEKCLRLFLNQVAH